MPHVGTGDNSPDPRSGKHGLVVNHDKTEGPSQSITFLGLGIDSVNQVTFVPDDKVGELLQLAGDMHNRTHTKLRHLQS